MRYRLLGISRLAFAGIALLPMVMWILFRWYDQTEFSLYTLFFVYRDWFLWSLPLYAVWSSIWIFLFRRAWFDARFGYYSIAILEIGYEFYVSMAERNIQRIGIELLLVLLWVGIYLWLERLVASAAYHPQIRWFEGDPKPLPQLTVRLNSQEAKVIHCDQKGFFALIQGEVGGKAVEKSVMKSWLNSGPISFEIRFKQWTATGEAKLVSVFQGQSLGIGLQFLPKDLYHLSQYTALVENVKGEGYVTS